MQTIPAVEQKKKTSNDQCKRIHGVSVVGEEKVYGEKDLPKSQVLKQQNERLNEWEQKRCA